MSEAVLLSVLVVAGLILFCVVFNLWRKQSVQHH